MTDANQEFDATHPSGQVLFRSCRGGFLHSVALAEAALTADASTLAEAILRTAEVSHLRALMEVRDEILASGHTPSEAVPTPADLRAATARLADHDLFAE